MLAYGKVSFQSLVKDKAIAVATQRKENKQEVGKRMEKGVKKSGGKAATCERREDGNLLIKAHSEHQWEQATFHFIEEKNFIISCLIKKRKKWQHNWLKAWGSPRTCYLL